MEGRDVVPPKPKVPEGPGQHGRIDEQVGDDHHQRPLPNRLGEFVEHLRQAGRALRLGLFDHVERQPQVGRAPPRRQRADDPLGGTGDADGVTLLAGQIPQRPADPPGVVDLGQRLDADGRGRRPEGHRPAGVEHEHEPEVGVGLVLLDVKPVGPAEGPPVEPPEVVAGDVLAVFGEFDARAAVGARVPARDVPHHRPPREQRHAGEPREHGRFEKTARLAIGEHGSLTRPARRSSPAPAARRSAWRRCPPPALQTW